MKYFFKLMLLLCATTTLIRANAQRLFYEIKAYHFKDAQQEISLDTYLQTAYIPAIHRIGKIKVGVFKPIANDTSADKIIYVITPFISLNEITIFPQLLLKDKTYQEAGKDYITASYQNPPYSRIETTILYAFELAPNLTLPHLDSNKQNHIYELRSYESPTENYHQNKLKMFNEGGEVDAFKRINSNAVFYGDVIAGSHMPNLMYLTSYENMDDRDAHWKSFTDDAQMKKIFAMDEYKNNVSKADIFLMHATSYSDY